VRSAAAPAAPPASDEDEPAIKDRGADEAKAEAPAFNADFEGAPAAPVTKDTDDPAPAGGGDECIDTNDPGSAENVSKKLPDTDDCDNDYKTISGVMKSAVDVDFYSLSVTDKGFNGIKGWCSFETDFEAQTAGTELCVFMRCKNTTKDAVTGCEQGTQKKSDIGMNGCCAAAPGRAVPKWDCDGISDNDSADIYLRVSQIKGDSCLPYKVRYRF
jgi:hypothetical protein